MHQSNRLFWRKCAKSNYRKWFYGPGQKVLEVGSMEVCGGTVRPNFHNFSEYIGVDWRPGPCVDVVCLAKDMQFDHKFDVVISASMLEHDPTWRESIQRMVQLLKPDGILLLSWGAAKNKKHSLESASDGGFHALPAGLVLKELKNLGIYVHEFRYEGKLPYVAKKSERCFGGTGMGEVCLVGFWDEKVAPKEYKGKIDKLEKEDDV